MSEPSAESLEKARVWLRAQVMDMGDCEDELAASLGAVLDTIREEERERMRREEAARIAWKRRRASQSF
jgi:predicted transposase YbfD/YdcC